MWSLIKSKTDYLFMVIFENVFKVKTIIYIFKPLSYHWILLQFPRRSWPSIEFNHTIFANLCINKWHHPQTTTTTADAVVEGPPNLWEPKILNFTKSYNIFQSHSYSLRDRIKVMRAIALNHILFLFRLNDIE